MSTDLPNPPHLPEPTPPATTPPDPVISAGLDIAVKWGAALGADKLEIALRALEPQLKREHQILMKRLDMERAAADRGAQAATEAAERAARQRQEQNKHNRHMAGLAAGVVIAIAMLGAGVYVAQDAWWLAALLCGPSLLALAKIFVLRRSDPDDMKFVAQASRTATNTAGQAQQSPPSVP
ncbi:hypothetical protein ACIBL6_18740 [Streptomyces sp. NPDC050400]|uniref:hypothetical protein n=1 Tax=Streptomyces sp. NPDC050400 TaxID=3365610 RepID=UPI00379E5DD9